MSIPTVPVTPVETTAVTDYGRIFAAEFVGTVVLVLCGPGTAILAPQIGQLGIALAFGFALLVMAYVVGHVTGCNINPAVTLGMLLTRKLTFRDGGVLLGRPGARRHLRRGHRVRDRQWA